MPAVSGIWRAVKAGVCALLVLAGATMSHGAAQQNANVRLGAVTKLPLPRFVSLKADEVNVRVGPGSDYAIAWVFKRPGLPVEILSEFDNWRQIRDSEGGTGWVAAALLSGRRTALVAPWVKEKKLFDLYSSRSGGEILARIEAGAIVDIVQCDGTSCEVYAGSNKGWLPQKNVWGVYPLEVIE